jgi:subtilisin family serine protease
MCIQNNLIKALILAFLFSMYSVNAADTNINFEKLSNRDIVSKIEAEGKIDVLVTISTSEEIKKLSQKSIQDNPKKFKDYINAGGKNKNTGYIDLTKKENKDALAKEIRKSLNSVAKSLDKNEIKIKKEFSLVSAFYAEVTLKGLEQLSNNTNIVLIEENLTFQSATTQGLSLINGFGVRNSYSGTGISIAIIDSGVDTAHPSLGGTPNSIFNSKVIGGFDFGDNDADPRPSSGDAHGTAVSGIAAGNITAVGDYAGGVASDAKIYSLKTGSGNPAFHSYQAIASALDWASSHQYDNLNNPIMIVNMSIGDNTEFSSICDSGNGSYSLMGSAADIALMSDIAIFAASGNTGHCSGISAPACLSSVISVGAVYDNALGSRSVCVSGNSCITNKSLSSQCTPSQPYIAFESAQADKVIGYTNMSSLLDILAPSADAYTTDIVGSAGYSSGNYTTDFNGTSASSPYAAGAAAILQQSAKSLTGNFLSVSELKSILINTGNPVTDDKVNITKPRINIGNAINFLESNNSTFEGLTPNGTTTGVTPTFTWTPLAGQTEYWVIADNGSSLSWPYVVYQAISATSANCGSGTCSYNSGVNFAPGTAVWQVKAPQSSGSWPETSFLNFNIN